MALHAALPLFCKHQRTWRTRCAAGTASVSKQQCSSSTAAAPGVSPSLASSRRAVLISLLPASMLLRSPSAVVAAEAPSTEAAADGDTPEEAARALFAAAFAATTLDGEESGWSAAIAACERSQSAPWSQPLRARALTNRGNARSRQGRLAEALEDYDAAAVLAPNAPDPLLNKGVALEALGRWDEALACYDALLASFPADPAGHNNRGNALLGLRRYAEAAGAYEAAVALAPEFAFAAANRAEALWAAGRKSEAVASLRALLRRYPGFDDARAALAAAYWDAGRASAAEGEWARVEDPRYGKPAWVVSDRRWPPPLAQALADFGALRPQKR